MIIIVNLFLIGFLRGVGAVSIKPENSRNAMQNIINLLNDDCVVGLFPEGHVSTTGELSDLKRGFEKVLSQSKDGVNGCSFCSKQYVG